MFFLSIFLILLLISFQVKVFTLQKIVCPFNVYLFNFLSKEEILCFPIPTPLFFGEFLLTTIIELLGIMTLPYKKFHFCIIETLPTFLLVSKYVVDENPFISTVISTLPLLLIFAKFPLLFQPPFIQNLST